MITMSSDSWEKFILRGENDPQTRKVILDSWDRCKTLGVSHELKEVFSHTTETEFNQRKMENNHLIKAATTIMLDLYNQLNSGGYLLLLADAEGYLIEMMADSKAQTIADRGGISTGAKWMEENVGSTGLSIALRTRAPMATSGYEHFCSTFRVWDCAACPIFVDDQFVGVFDVCRVGPGNDIKELYAIAVAGAKAIGERIRFDKLKEKEVVMSHALAEYSNIKQGAGIITFDSLGHVIFKDRIAEKFIRLLESENGKINGLNQTLKLPILERFTGPSEQKGNIVLGDCEFSLQSKEIFHKGGKMGALIFVEPEGKNSPYFPVPEIHKNNPILLSFPTKSPKLVKTLSMASKIANSDASILVQGESGSGKDYLTRAIHEHSKRRESPFVALNCASLPRDLIASELFGYPPGAFTGANKQGNAGKVEAANGGTLFLDEIGDMPIDLQAVLLRTLEEKHIVRIGSNKWIPVDVRIISATHKDLKKLVQQGLFREDLYYRLSVFQLQLPPLRERKEDMGHLLKSIMESSCEQANRKAVQFTRAAVEHFQKYAWPGNLRELRNIVEQITYLHEKDVFDGEDVKDYISIENEDKVEIEDERTHIQSVLNQVKGNRSEAARLLGISRGALYRKLTHYSIK